MKITITTAEKFEKRPELADHHVWVNRWDNGGIIITKETVTHGCARHTGSDIEHEVVDPELCPKKCGTNFYPFAWTKTRQLYDL